MPGKLFLYRSVVSCALIVVASLCGNAQTAPSPSLFSAVQTCISSQPSGGVCDIESSLQDAEDSSLLTLNTTFAPRTAQVRMHVNNVAQAQYGLMRVAAEDTFQVGSVPMNTNSYAIAAFQDVLTVNLPPSNAPTGYMTIQYTLNGKVSATPANSASEGIFGCGITAPGFTNYGGEALLDAGSTNGLSSGALNGVFTFPNVFQFTYGQPFTLYCTLLTDAGTYDAQGEYATVTGRGSAIANFANTAVISGLAFTDANGNPLAVTPSITAASGTSYFPTGILTPFRKLEVDELEVGGHGKQIQLEGGFSLAAKATGFDPLTEDLAFQVGTFSRVIPLGSFRRTSTNAYGFDGTVNGVTVHARIKRESENWFSFDIRAAGTNLTATSSPLKVTIDAGMNGGSTQATANKD